ncbi:hypothetical protein LTR37_019343 [Vermiconidia calcicola]|uniref:Uncharacterized protein n=1 Tax=Vermiconidia calcicola TaxID=1690605 RepID=A0ACC3MFI7_9PEZI|nr:hypothetical protein LTR37_019343 [Vermiconidia calcicola]
MNKAMSRIDSLPEELQLQIFQQLDSLPPSELKARQEPSLQVIRSAQHPLKDLSRVSKRWRRIVLPLLFKHACLRFGNPEPTGHEICTICGLGSYFRPIHPQFSKAESCHVEIASAISKQSTLQPSNLVSTSSIVHPQGQAGEAATAPFALRSYHEVQDLLAFVRKERLVLSITSFVLLIEQLEAEKASRYPPRPRDWRYPAAADLWQQLLSVVDPERICILAPPIDLACLTNAAIDTVGDWAFSDMAFHFLELRQDSSMSHTLTEPVDYKALAPFPGQFPGFAASSLIRLRPWAHVSLNEGSFLKAYGTYEYFERGPPSLVYSINHCFTPLGRSYQLIPGTWPLSALRTFTYTAIFPFSNHVDFKQMLPYIEELDVRFAPDVESGILDDRQRIGRAQLQDCWQELTSAYYALCAVLSTHRMSEAIFPKLKKFVCGDSRVEGIREDLEELFTPLHLPVWAEMRPGVFERLAMSPRLPGINDQV